MAHALCLSSIVVVAESIFFAALSSNTEISDGEVIAFDSVLFDPGLNYNASLGSYTAPVTGYYQ